MTLRCISDYLNNLPNYGPLEAATARLGRPLLDLDFGAGYKYPVLLEKATITPAQ